MKLYKVQNGVIIESEQGEKYFKAVSDWDIYINRDDLYNFLQNEIKEPGSLAKDQILSDPKAPISKQEVWAAGVTYLKSRDARMQESKEAGGSTFYDKVYDHERPELFFKATAQRVAGPNEFVRIRKDSTWDVPEPELTLMISSSGKIIGYTIGNDMSSRSIEGENPLYLPQAKVYEKCAALGPCIYVHEKPLPAETKISIQIRRDQQTVFKGSVPVSQMKRKHQDLVDFLYRECSFPYGCFLMTGTGVVPSNDFTLRSGDEIIIEIDHIGTLKNIVE